MNGEHLGPNILSPLRMPLDPLRPFSENVKSGLLQVGWALNLKTTIAFVGNGCSRALGYPGWSDAVHKLLRESAAQDPELRRLLPESSASGTDQGPGDRPNVRELMFLAEMCKQRLETRGDAWGSALREAFAQGSRPPLSQQPLEALIDLPIRRFVTTNYDDELEKLLERDEDEPKPLGFTWKEPHADRLAKFVQSQVPQQRMVFHCHGRFDELDDLILTENDYRRLYLGDLLGENAHFRQALALVLGSGPVLFVGYGMQDQDLMRYLRILTAQEGRQGVSRPVFALLPWAGPDDGQVAQLSCLQSPEEPPEQPPFEEYSSWVSSLEQTDPRAVLQFKALYLRYGVIALPYPVAKKEEGGRVQVEAYAGGLTRHLQRLARVHRYWESEWLLKPRLRKIDVKKRLHDDGRRYLHGFFRQDARSKLNQHALESLKTIERKIRTEASSRGGVISIVGPGGTGKSWLAGRLLDSLAEPRLDRPETEAATAAKHGAENPLDYYDGFFFWSAYYADDHLTAMDRAIAFLESRGPSGAAAPAAGHERHQRFKELLTKSGDSRYLLVFDGMERLLTPVERSPDDDEAWSFDVPPDSDDGRALLVQRMEKGVASTGEGSRLFRDLARPSKHTIVLTTRLLPTHFREAARHVDIRPVPVAKPTLPEVLRWLQAEAEEGKSETQPEDEVDENAWRQLYYLLDGHIYGLVLAEVWCRRLDQRPQDLVRHLRARSRSQRLNEVIERVLNMPIAKGGVSTDLRGLVARLATFMKPIRAEVFDVCMPEAAERTGRRPPNAEKTRQAAERLRRELVERRLLFEVGHLASGVKEWTLHPTIRAFCYRKLHGAQSGALPNFTLAGFTSQTAQVYPGDQGRELVLGLLDTLLDRIEELIATTGKERHASVRLARSFCRSVLSVVRGRMEANTVPLWTDYRSYLAIGVRLLDMARRIARASEGAPGLWSYMTESEAKEPWKHGPFYPEELAWLYNDHSLALLAEGSMRSAHALCEQAHQIDDLVAQGDTRSQYVVQALLHLAHIRIELGDLNDGLDYLDLTERANSQLRWRDYDARIAGYRALVSHLQNKLNEADSGFEATLEMLRGQRPAGEHRGAGSDTRAVKRSQDVQGDPGKPTNKRALAVFMRYHADLNLARRSLGDAAELVEESRSLAAAHRHPDLVAYCDNSMGRLLREQGRLPEARRCYDKALAFARQRGIRRLEADVLCELARLGLATGDIEAAIRRAMDSLRIASQLGLGLRLTQSMVVLGKADVEAERLGLGTRLRRFGVGLLRNARDKADRQQYYKRKTEVEAFLQEIGEEIEC